MVCHQNNSSIWIIIQNGIYNVFQLSIRELNIFKVSLWIEIVQLPETNVSIAKFPVFIVEKKGDAACTNEDKRILVGVKFVLKCSLPSQQTPCCFRCALRNSFLD